MTAPDKSFKPIGWYLKEADALITRFFNSSLENSGITRSHWQVIKTIADEGRLNKKEYYRRVNRFLTEQELEHILFSLLERGWLLLDKEDYFFTNTGKIEFERVETIQNQNREKMLAGTKPNDYYTTLTFLSLVIKNLGGTV
ncbi:hypothetical protein ACX0G9_29855 [Flavitalea flava]